ncbi:TPA: cytoplasmic protein [Bacillus pseudomycoides]|nr:cytoplasmic protein [Bacillus pseudomycoides]
MKTKQYETIKLQMNQEKEHVLKEVYELTTEKRKIEAKKAHDLNVFQSRSKVMQVNESIHIGMLSSHTFSPERIEEWNRKIEKIEEFILKNKLLLEQIQEKERVIDEMFQQNCQKAAKEQGKREEKMLLDLRMCMNG